jgi:hypothetical protein
LEINEINNTWYQVNLMQEHSINPTQNFRKPNEECPKRIKLMTMLGLFQDAKLV